MFGSRLWDHNPEVEIFTTNDRDDPLDLIYFPGSRSNAIHLATDASMLAVNVMKIIANIRLMRTKSLTKREVMYNTETHEFDTFSTYHPAQRLQDAARFVSPSWSGHKEVNALVREFTMAWQGLQIPGYYEFRDHLPRGDRPMVTRVIHKKDLVPD
jgi:hypothetical protein